MSNKSKPSYEAAMKELQEIVGLLQEEVISMDDISEKVKRAAWLISYCREKLRSTEKEVQCLFEEKS